MDNVIKTIFSGDTRALEAAAGRGVKTIQTYGSKAQRAFVAMGKQIDTVSQRFWSPGGLIGGAALLKAGKDIIEFDARLARLKNQAEISTKEMISLKNSLFDVGMVTHQDPGALLGGIEKIVEKTGDFEYAKNAIKDIGLVASATGSEVADIASTAADLRQKMNIAAKDILPVFDILLKQGKEGAFELKDMAGEFPALLASAAMLGVQGVDGMRKFGAFIQIARRGFGDAPGEAGTSIDAVLRQLTQKSKEIKKVTKGFDIWDAAKSKAAGRHVMKDLDVVLKEIIKRTNGDVKKLQSIFDLRAIKAINPFAQSWLDAGKTFRDFDQFINMGGDGVTVMKDLGFWSEQTAARIKDFQTQIKKFADVGLAGPIDDLNKALKFLNENPIWVKIGGLTALVGFLLKVFGVTKTLALAAGKVGWDIGRWSDKNGGNVLQKTSDLLFTRAGTEQISNFTDYILKKIYDPDLEGQREYLASRPPRLSPMMAPAQPAGTPQLQNNININLRIDKNGRTFSDTTDMNTYLNLDTGDYFK